MIGLSQLITINGTFDSQTDGSLKPKGKDSLHILSFTSENISKTFSYKKKEAIDFQLINSTQLKQIFSQNEFTWVFIQASWCGGCNSSLKKYIKLADSLDQIRIVVINQDMRIRSLQHKIFNEGFKSQPYLLDPKEYGTYEPDKQSKFVGELTDLGKLVNYNPKGVPHNFFFNRKGELIYYGPNDITSQTLKEKVLKSE
ncbi:MAG: hypothetical protein M3R27_10950 [Bacteroidota bacterium]|nr:hypothetical protein [Bacteroidota bacterium]